MSDNGSTRFLTARACQRWLNQRPGWEISLRRVYFLLLTGAIPSTSPLGAHNKRYRVSPADLEKWSRVVEAKAERKQRVRE